MKTQYPTPECILSGEKYLVGRKNGVVEIIIQSDWSIDRAGQSVEMLNEHEILNAREPTYFWRLIHKGETNDIHRNRRKRNSSGNLEGYAVNGKVYGLTGAYS